jgi:hypothetical protein
MKRLNLIRAATQGMSGKVVTIAIVCVGLALASATSFAAAAGDATKKENARTPEIKLVDDYNAWLAGMYMGDLDKLKAGLAPYITDQTVLYEAKSLPWGGKMVGYDGWVRLCRIAGPIFAKLSPLLEASRSKYYQYRNVVLHETSMTIRGSTQAPEPLTFGIIEKYIIENGRIKQIDEFYADTASLVERLKVLGAMPPNEK